jgi:hypothetical protein
MAINAESLQRAPWAGACSGPERQPRITPEHPARPGPVLDGDDSPAATLAGLKNDHPLAI